MSSRAQERFPHHQQFSLDVPRSFQTVVVLALSERLAVDVSGKIAHSRLDSTVQGAAISQMASETHSSRTDTAIAGRQ